MEGGSCDGGIEDDDEVRLLSKDELVVAVEGWM